MGANCKGLLSTRNMLESQTDLCLQPHNPKELLSQENFHNAWSLQENLACSAANQRACSIGAI